MYYVLTGVLIGFAGVAVKSISISLGVLMSGFKPAFIIPYATALSTISETLIVFTDILVSHGYLQPEYKVLAISLVASAVFYQSTSQ